METIVCAKQENLSHELQNTNHQYSVFYVELSPFCNTPFSQTKIENKQHMKLFDIRECYLQESFFQTF